MGQPSTTFAKLKDDFLEEVDPMMMVVNDKESTKYQVIFLIVKLSVTVGTAYFTLKWMVNMLDPTRQQKKKAKKKAEMVMQRLGIQQQLNEYELMIASQLIVPQNINVKWSDIAGLDDIIQEIEETIIMPIQQRHLLAGSQLAAPPKGVLLYGPPGCGKTLIAKAMANEAGAHFINLDVSSLTDKWYGESQKLAAAVFSLAYKIQPCIIFLDEIDSLLRSRDSHDHEATAMVKAQFMSLWDGLATADGVYIVIMGATNRPRDVDKAILRRMPSTFSIPPPNEQQREDILRLILSTEPVAEGLNYESLAAETDGFSGSDLKELCRAAAVRRLNEYVRTTSASERQVKADPSAWIYHSKSPSWSTMLSGMFSKRSWNKRKDDSRSCEAPARDEFLDALRPIEQSDFTSAIVKMKKSKHQCGSLLPSTTNRLDLD